MARAFPFLTLCALFLVPPNSPAAVPDAAGVEFFEKKIRPVLVESCYSCHSAEAKKIRAGLLLDSREGLLKGGESGPSVVPGKAKESLLFKALQHQDELRMPPKGKLAETVLADFARWIEMGAPDPRDGKAATVVSRGMDLAEGRQFWSFQAPRKVAPPPVKDAAWPKGPIDHFILARLEEKGLRPARFADQRALLRRMSFDLTGLPPTPEEVADFEQAAARNPQAALGAVVDRLLASPHYGERWGRYWLDVARYAEDQAHTFGVKPNTSAWRYRDWVIDALNEDMPYDRFVRLQIAADLIEKDEGSRIRHLPALGFFGLGAQYYKNSDAAKVIADELDDRVDTLSRGFLGLTVSCARCHDHKFDPVPQKDYYSLAGVFSSCRLADVPVVSNAQQQRFQAHQGRIKKVQNELQTLVRTEKTKLAEGHASELARYLIAAWRYQARKQKESKWSTNQQAKKDGLESPLLTRCVKFLEKAPALPGLGSWAKVQAGEEAQAVALAQAFERRVQEALAARAKRKADKSANDLLEKLFGDKGPFTPSDGELKAKLSADKVQQMEQMKGELTRLQKDEAAKPLPVAHGLVEAGSADMKVYVRGNPASPGEVAPRRFLRILAGDEPRRFAQGSGRLELAEAVAAKDNPLTARVIVNRLWQHHFGRGLVGTPSNFGKLGEAPTHPELLDYLACRLVESGWSLKALHREILLSSVYQLGSERDEKNFGVDGDNRLLWRMNRRRLDVEAWRDAMLAVAGKLDRTRGGPTLDLGNAANVRRTIYAKISRHDLNPLLRMFDFPDANITSERRTETTVPQQQLFVLNSAFVVEMAKGLAERVQKEAADDEGRMRRAVLLAYGRPAAPEEIRLAVKFLSGRDDPAEQPANRLSRWERLAQALLGSNEFLYVD